jgi:hypothetical protein
LPATIAFDYPTISALADYLAGEVLPPEEPAAPAREPSVSEGDFSAMLDRIENLSEEEVDRMYSQQRAQ